MALLVKDAQPPDGLDSCPFFVKTRQKPVVLSPLSEIETVCSPLVLQMLLFKYARFFFSISENHVVVVKIEMKKGFCSSTLLVITLIICYLSSHGIINQLKRFFEYYADKIVVLEYYFFNR